MYSERRWGYIEKVDWVLSWRNVDFGSCLSYVCWCHEYCSDYLSTIGSVCCYLRIAGRIIFKVIIVKISILIGFFACDSCFFYPEILTVCSDGKKNKGQIKTNQIGQGECNPSLSTSTNKKFLSITSCQAKTNVTSVNNPFILDVKSWQNFNMESNCPLIKEWKVTRLFLSNVLIV